MTRPPGKRTENARPWERLLLAGGFAMIALSLATTAQPTSDKPIAIAVHGGAGTISNQELTDAMEAEYRGKLAEALRVGHARLEAGRSSVDAVVAAIEVLERSPLFNAGAGAVFTWEGRHELDASLMVGDTLRAGGLTGVRTVRSPIRLAWAVMEASPHVLLSGRGAERFAAEQGLEMVTNDHFSTDQRRQELRRLKDQAGGRVPGRVVFGTVGAVALDSTGTLAAGTSTGGLAGKRWGRVGDSPIVGAGTYADNRSCAVSATGHGEYFIRYNVAADICARVRYTGVPIETAGHQVLFDELSPAGGFGGVVIMDPTGHVAMPFNTDGMYRGKIDTRGELSTAIH